MPKNILNRHNVTVLGEGEETLVFSNGFGTDQSAWKNVIEPFKQNYKIVLYDTIGSGTTNLNDYSVEKYNNLQAFANDLLDVVNALEIQSATLIAHSVGGMAGLLASIKAPGKFPRMVMIGASPRYLNDVNYIGGFEQSDLDDLYSAMESNYFSWVSGFASATMTYPERPELAREFANTLSAIRPDIAQSVARTIFSSDLRDMVPKLKSEVLLIQSSEDIAVPKEVAEYLHKNIAGSTLNIISSTGHFPHISQPQEIINALKIFLKK